nr:fatty-acid-binding protein 1-like [Ipomoea batatas]
MYSLALPNFDKGLGAAIKKLTGGKTQNSSHLTMAEASDDIKLRAGSVIEISRLLGYVLQIKVMGEVMSTVESKLLCRACIYLYLGNDPFDKEAKDKFGCLGHTCCLPFK